MRRKRVGANFDIQQQAKLRCTSLVRILACSGILLTTVSRAEWGFESPAWEMPDFSGVTMGVEYSKRIGSLELRDDPAGPWGSRSGNKILSLDDAGDGLGPLLFEQSYVDQPYSHTFSFAFRLEELTGNPWSASYKNLGILIDAPGNQLLFWGRTVLTLEPGIWYGVIANAQEYKSPRPGYYITVYHETDGWLGSYEEKQLPFSEIPITPVFPTPTDRREGLRIQDYASDAKNSRLDIDRVTSSFPSIPEPATVSMLIMGLVSFGFSRRFRPVAGRDR